MGGAVRSASNVSNADLLFGCFCYGAKRDEPGEGPAMHMANASGSNVSDITREGRQIWTDHSQPS